MGVQSAGTRVANLIALFSGHIAPATIGFVIHILDAPTPPAIIHCHDLDTLLAGVILKRALGVRLIYDAHEFWPDADPHAREFERKLLSAIERRLVHNVDGAVCVSPGLCTHMEALYGVPFQLVPNAAPLESVSDRTLRSTLKGLPVRFLYQGGYAPSRGLDILIRALRDVDPQRARFFLRGPANAYRDSLVDLARELRVLDAAVSFLDPVPEDELIEAASTFDVGLIPYEPTLLNHLHCCPNKLSQYMQAGLMILASDTQYVSQLVRSADAGLIYDSADIASLRAAIETIVAQPNLIAQCGEHARNFAESTFNWRIQSAPYRKLWLV